MSTTYSRYLIVLIYKLQIEKSSHLINIHSSLGEKNLFFKSSVLFYLLVKHILTLILKDFKNTGIIQPKK